MEIRTWSSSKYNLALNVQTFFDLMTHDITPQKSKIVTLILHQIIKSILELTFVRLFQNKVIIHSQKQTHCAVSFFSLQTLLRL